VKNFIKVFPHKLQKKTIADKQDSGITFQQGSLVKKLTSGYCYVIKIDLFDSTRAEHLTCKDTRLACLAVLDPKL